MKLIEHIYAIKNVLAHGPASDDFSFSDRLISHYLQVARARLIEQKIDKYYYISEQSYQDLCVDLTLSSFHDCCDIPDLDECKVMKSIAEVPKFLNSRWGNHLKVTDLVGNVIPELSITQNKYAKYALSKPGTGWFMHNNKIYIVNNKVLKKILLNGLFDDPESIHNLNCPNITDGNCPSYFDADFPIDPDLIDPMYRITLELLGKVSFPNDIENNARDVQTTNAAQ